MSAATRLLIVDDDSDAGEALETLLRGGGYTCALVGSGAAALDALRRHPFDAIISDVRMPDMDGLELLDRVRRTHPVFHVVLVTGQGAIREAIDATKRGAF